MKRTTVWRWFFVAAIAVASISASAEDKKANELLQSGVTKETIQGDLAAAIDLYEKAVKEAGANRALSAKAQLRLGAAYQKQGSEKARVAFERLLREYSDQREAAAEAQARLAALVGARQRPVSVGATTQVPIPTNQPDRQVTLFDRQGKLLGTVGDFGPVDLGRGAMTLSPDGTRVAIDTEGRISTIDIATKAVLRITTGRADAQPAWSPDSSRIAFQTLTGVYITNANGAGTPELVYSGLGSGFTLVSWSPDGAFLTFQQRGDGTAYDIWMLPLVGDRKPVPLLVEPAAQTGGRVSPDGRYFSYRSNESGQNYAYVHPFAPGKATPADEKWKVSVDPVAVAGVKWRGDGKEMYYIGADGGFMAVDVTTTPTFKAGAPRLLFKLPAAYQAVSNTAGYSDVSRDGKIFAIYMPKP